MCLLRCFSSERSHSFSRKALRQVRLIVIAMGRYRKCRCLAPHESRILASHLIKLISRCTPMAASRCPVSASARPALSQ
jgi:hypothetical protein